MRTNQTTATMGTTAAAVAFAYPATVAFRTSTMWFSPAKHANKRRTRQPSGVLN